MNNIVSRFRRPEPPDISLSTLAELLSNKRRRRVVEALRDQEEVRLGDLAERIAELEEGEEPKAQARKRVYIALHQSHLPKMDTNDVVDYDVDGKVVSRGSEYDGVLWLTDTLADNLEH